MKRTLVLLALLICLVAAYFLLNKKEDTKMEQLYSERTFKVADVKQIYRIVIKSDDKGKLDLRKIDGIWIANDSIEVWRPHISQLKGTLGMLEVKYTPTQIKLPVMEKSFKEAGIYVYAFDQKGKELISFVLGGVTPDETGTYAKRLDSDNPFIIHIPHLPGNIRERFDYTTNDLKNKFFFEEEWDEIDKVTVEYPMGYRNPFVMVREKGSYYVAKPGAERSSSEGIKIERGRAEAYLMHFEELGFEAYENAHPFKDSIAQLTPFASVTLEKEDGETKWIKLYPWSGEIGKLDLSDEYLTKDEFFRYLAHTDDGDLILIQDLSIGHALKEYEYFFK